MISEASAQRIAAALERLAQAIEARPLNVSAAQYKAERGPFTSSLRALGDVPRDTCPDCSGGYTLDGHSLLCPRRVLIEAASRFPSETPANVIGFPYASRDH